MAIPKNVAPSGLPTWRRRYVLSGFAGTRPSRSLMVVLRRKSWVIATPIEAKAREVRSQARNVRSGGSWSV